MSIGGESIGVAVLGAGRMGQTHIRNLAGITDATVVAVADPIAAAAEAGRALARAELAFTDPHEAIRASGVDAVLSTLGVFIKEPGTPVTDMTGPIVQAMRQKGVKRLVCMSSLGVGETAKLGNLTVKFVTRVILRHVLVDKQCQEKLIEHSGLEWTILRPPRILDSDDSVDYLRWQAEPGVLRPRWQISKSDASKEMLALLEDDSSIHQTWHISN
jgi:uncharacterized protein YbjT (DUF2867 family)